MRVGEEKSLVQLAVGTGLELEREVTAQYVHKASQFLVQSLARAV